MWEISSNAAHIPINEVSVHAFFSKSFGTNQSKLRIVHLDFSVPICARHLEKCANVLWNVESRFVVAHINGLFVQFLAHERKFCIGIASSFAGVFHFKTWRHGCKVTCKTKMPVESKVIHEHSWIENKLARVVVHLNGVPDVGVLLQVGVVRV